MNARISVIVPTVGRTTLGRTLRSCADADEVLVDYNQDGDNGYAARTRAIARATGTHLAFLDDDDVYTAGAIGKLREQACDRPVIFKMRYTHGGVLWQREDVVFGNVGTPMFLVPNDPERLGEWKGHGGTTGGDYTFISGCVARMGDPVWVDHVIADINPG